MRRWPALLVTLLLLASCGSSSDGGDDGDAARPTIELGAVLSLSGAAASYGAQQQRGIELATELLNDRGGVNGARVHVGIEDDRSDPDRAAQATRQLVDEGVVGLIGPTLSNSAVAAHPVAEDAHTPMLAVSNTGSNIVGRSPYSCSFIFRDSLGEEDAIPANIRAYANARHPASAVLLYPTDDKFSSDSAAIARASAEANGMRILASIEFTKAEADLTPYVTRAVSLKPDVVLITSLGDIPPKVMREARRQGFKGQFLGGNGFNSPAISAAAGEAGKGAQSASAWYETNTMAANETFISAYRARFDAAPDQFAAQAYTGVLLLANALRSSGVSDDLARDRTRLRAALELTRMDTPLGPFRFTPDHDVSQTIWILAMDGRGGFELVTSVVPTPTASP